MTMSFACGVRFCSTLIWYSCGIISKLHFYPYKMLNRNNCLFFIKFLFWEANKFVLKLLTNVLKIYQNVFLWALISVKKQLAE